MNETPQRDPRFIADLNRLFDLGRAGLAEQAPTPADGGQKGDPVQGEAKDKDQNAP